MNQREKESRDPFLSMFRYFHFIEPPFGYRYDVRFFYPAPSRISILTKILSQSKHDFVSVMVLGESGTGKTILANNLMASLEKDNRVTVRYYVPQDIPNLEMNMQLLFDDLKLEWQESYDKSLKYLIAQFTRQTKIGTPYFLIVEDNFSRKLLQPDSILGTLFQLKQAGKLMFHLVWFDATNPAELGYEFTKFISEIINLPNMKYREMVGMIRFRCEVAGRKKAPFTVDALKKIFQITKGNPGMGIRLADFTLTMARGEQKSICEVVDVENAAEWIM
jgi:type II secretory pathway predicted ATPase ExeA